MLFKTVSVVGLGYIGLPTAAVLASKKIKVIGVDIDQKTVDIINNGEIHIVEPSLDVLVHAAVNQGYLRAVTKPEPADAFLIAVPTPFRATSSEIPEPDLSFIEKATKAIAPVLKKGDLVILESTCPVGSTEKIGDWLAESRPDLTFPQHVGDSAEINIAHCPERVLPGHVIRELVQNDRVIGGISSHCSDRAVSLYKIFVEGDCAITNARTAEMTKLTENSCRDVQIAFANELSMICDKLDINVWELISLANRHPRVDILQPGPGVGGHCIAVDPWFIINKTPREAVLIHAARKVNLNKTSWVEGKIKSLIGELLIDHPNSSVSDISIVCFGLTFKANIDDVRESPALEIVRKLAGLFGGQISVVDPYLNQLPIDLIGRVNLVEISESTRKLSIAVILVDHDLLKEVEFNRYEKILDTRGLTEKNIFL
jgi:UDP-N-acetyl-D-mannosaminuronic acid dehydrogenase